MRRASPIGYLVAAVAWSVWPGVATALNSEEAETIREAATVLNEMMNAPDQAIPKTVLERAQAIAVFPSTLKGGFIIGGHHGDGIISVRNEKDPGWWSAPAFLNLTGGSFGLQIGAESVDVILVVMNRRGVEKLLGNNFKIGADAAVAAGPVGRDAEVATDIQLRAEILSYSRARGLFAGVSLKGTVIDSDDDSNKVLYGQPYKPREIVLENKAGWVSGTEPWQEALRQHARMSKTTN